MERGRRPPPRRSAARPGPQSEEPNAAGERGAHTLKVHRGTIVGIYGDDVFVDLGPRVQGVISLARFGARPAIGSQHDFTLRGQEEGLWALALGAERSLATWETMEPGSVIEARVVRPTRGGLEAKVGPLHAFLPKSQTGLARDQELRVLAGKTLVCEVIEIDRERQRVVLSRKLVQQRERASEHGRELGSLRPGERVQGVVARVEPFGVFVEFGRGLIGLAHVSNLAWERVRDPRALFAPGDDVEAVVLTIRRGGKRIGLGIKQLEPSPWRAVDAETWVGRIVGGRVVRVLPFGVFVSVHSGIEGLVPRAHSGLGPGEGLARAFRSEQELAVRVVSVDPERERMELSVLSAHGARLCADDVDDVAELARRALERADAEGRATTAGALGRALRAAFERPAAREDGSRPAQGEAGP